MAVNDKTCSICLDHFTKPKIIDCRHTFCESCLDDYVQTRYTNNQFPCPLCRQINTVPEGGVKDYKVNFHALMKKKPVPVPRRKRVENVEIELQIIRTQLEEQVRTEIACNNSMVNSLKKEVSTLARQYAEERGKVDQRTEQMCQIIKDEGKKLKLKMKDSNLEHTTVIRKKIKAVEQQTRQITEFGKQMGQIFNKNQLEEKWEMTRNLMQVNKDFAVPAYSCPKFQDGITNVEGLSKQIGQIRKMRDGNVYGQTPGYMYRQTPGFVFGQGSPFTSVRQALMRLNQH